MPVAARPALPAACRAAALLGIALLAGCGSDDTFAPACPGLTLLPDAADLTRYRAGGRDLTDMVADARITAVPAECSRRDAKTVAAVVSVSFALTRGPAASGRQAVLPYFVGVTRGGQVLDEQDYALQVAFPPNIDSLAASGEQITLAFPVDTNTSAADYRIFVGFRLTPAELAANRARGVR